MSKLSLSRAWEETTHVLAHEGRLLLPVALALFVLPGLLLNVSLPDVKADQLPEAGLWIAVAFIAFLVSLIGQLAVIRLSIEPHVSVGEAIVHGAKRLLPYVLSVLLWIVPLFLIGAALYGFLGPVVDPSGSGELAGGAGAAIGASLALIAITLIGTFLGIRLILSSAVASAENLGPTAIIRRSWALSRGNWWRLFVFLLLFVVAALCLILAVDSVATVVVRLFAADAGPRSLGGLIVSIVSQLVSAMLSVVFFVMLARLYAQRAEGEMVQPSVPSSGT